jgi:L,D-peptidoglycan transpeptidase YkuD (ErfK/YbiS/YcfS/YnhG family)
MPARNPALGPASSPAFEATSSGLIRAVWSGRVFRCAVGRSGVTPASAKREGDGATPAGVWRLGDVYWREDRLPRPRTGLTLIRTHPDMGWCDAPGDPRYNQPVLLPYSASAEHMWREDEVYDLCIVLLYNTDPVIAGMGSAIFLHIARPNYASTEGCLACAREDLLSLLEEAQPGDAVSIA